MCVFFSLIVQTFIRALLQWIGTCSINCVYLCLCTIIRILSRKRSLGHDHDIRTKSSLWTMPTNRLIHIFGIFRYSTKFTSTATWSMTIDVYTRQYFIITLFTFPTSCEKQTHEHFVNINYISRQKPHFIFLILEMPRVFDVDVLEMLSLFLSCVSFFFYSLYSKLTIELNVMLLHSLSTICRINGMNMHFYCPSRQQEDQFTAKCVHINDVLTCHFHLDSSSPPNIKACTQIQMLWSDSHGMEYDDLNQNTLEEKRVQEIKKRIYKLKSIHISHPCNIL